MKRLLQFTIITCGFMAFAARAGAQTGYFDPQLEPLAIRKDSVTQLLVSEYTLARSIKARMGPGSKVLRVYKDRNPSGEEWLMAEGMFYHDQQQPFVVAIPLVPDQQHRLLYAGAQALVCSTPGCNNCSIQNGICVGCCTTATGHSTVLQTPLLRISLTLEE